LPLTKSAKFTYNTLLIVKEAYKMKILITSLKCPGKIGVSTYIDQLSMYQDNIPYAVIDAQIAGIPVVVSDAGGIPKWSKTRLLYTIKHCNEFLIRKG
jgi:hypothetical protein